MIVFDMMIEFPNINPVAIDLSFIQIRWYAISYVTGILLSWFLILRIIKNKQIQINSEVISELISNSILGIILGGRLGYVLFYNNEYFINNILEIFKIWNGGMSFHGGLIGVIVASQLFSSKHKVNQFIFLDLVALSAPIGIFFGRVANFINSELIGRATDLPWSVQFILIDNIRRHPSQLYEAFFEGVVLFLLLGHFFRRDYLKNPGKISALFLIFYSLFRFFMEFFRFPDPQIGYLVLNLTLGQLISIIFLVVGILLFYLKNNEK